MANSPTKPAAIVPQLPLARYRLRFQSGESAALKGRYLGSAWRGAFGRALRRHVCITNLPRCDGCVLLEHCVYPRTFEKRTPTDAQKLRLYPNTPNPYVLAPAHDEWDVADETTNLGVTLFGAANDDAPTILQALQHAARTGLTGRRVVLKHVETQAETPEGHAWTAIQHESGNMHRSPARTVAPPPAPAPPTAVRVRLLSPLRLRFEERYVRPAQFSFRAFAASLLRRASLLTYFFGEQPLEVPFAALVDEAAGVRIKDAELRWWDGVRRSSRQQARIPMGGMVGSFVAEGAAICAFWPCLWLGQWTHVGKGCTMGLGRYVLEPVTSGEEEHWHGPKPL